MGVPLVKANAYGNDFLLAPDDGSVADAPAFTRAVCSRHLGVGADGLILFTMADRRATMRLWNADGSASELSGNGLRCLAAYVARVQDLGPNDVAVFQCGACGHTAELPLSALLRGLGLRPADSCKKRPAAISRQLPARSV